MPTTAATSARSVDVLEAVLPAGSFERHHPADRPERASLVACLDGTDPAAPTLLLLGHLDVVPVNPARWTRDPFGGEIVDGEVWGRGAVDMLNQTAAHGARLRRAGRWSAAAAARSIFAAVGRRGDRRLPRRAAPPRHRPTRCAATSSSPRPAAPSRRRRAGRCSTSASARRAWPRRARALPRPGRPRLDAAGRRQRARHRRRGGPPDRRGPSRHDDRRRLGGAGSRRRSTTQELRARLLDARTLWDDLTPAARRRRRACPRLHPQHVHADARRRRAEEQHRARRRRRSSSTSASSPARPSPTSNASSASCSPTCR